MTSEHSDPSSQSLVLTAEAVKFVAQANESRSRQLQDLERIAAWLQRDLNSQAEKLQRMDQELGAREVRVQSLNRLQANLWPAALRTEAWANWRAQVLGRAQTEGAMALLLARMHTVSAFEQAARPVPLELLRELGRSVYETFVEEAPRIAQALTQASGTQFELRTIRAGDRVDNKLMKPSTPGLVTVQTVAGWAVRDATGLWQFLADVS